MNPHLQHVASIANLLAQIDGSVHRACLECGAIFKIDGGSRFMTCYRCQKEAADKACCDSPHYRTISSASHEDGTTFATVVCEGCGARREVTL